MQTIDDFCNDVKKIHHLVSDRQLGKFLHVSQSAISGWRTKRIWPSDDVMIRIADATGTNRLYALLMLNVWRCFDDDVKQEYYNAAINCLSAKSSNKSIIP